MTVIAPSAGSAELWLISDFPVDDSQHECVRQLFGERTFDKEISFSWSRRMCRWPLRVSYPTAPVNSLSFHVHLCAGFLIRRRAVVERIRALGCNLELCVHVPGLTDYFSMSTATMKHLADLHIQFSLMPAAAADVASIDGGESTVQPK